MTTTTYVDNIPKLASRERRSNLLLEDFVRRRPTLRDSASTTKGQAADASTEAQALGTIMPELILPEGADYVTPSSRSSSRQPNFRVYQAWEGTVLDIVDDSFNARIRDITDPGRPDEMVEMFVEDVDDSDLPLLKPGAVFYWNIGYLEGLGFPRQRTSRVTFRRVPRFLASGTPVLSSQEIRDALAE
jgi:hypothetical protein